MSINTQASQVVWPRRHIFADAEVPQSFVFYDTETTGLDPNYDQIIQFAAIRTDAHFNIIDELEHTVNLRCRRLPWVVPSPQALLTTKVLPDDLDHEEYLPQEAMAIIAEKLQDWSPAVFIGYNSIRFDDEFLRRGFLSALQNPYLVPGPGSLRADLMHMVQAAHVMMPGALVIPPLKARSLFAGTTAKTQAIGSENPNNLLNPTDGFGCKTSSGQGDHHDSEADRRMFKLQALAEANGIALNSHEESNTNKEDKSNHAHDALVDVKTCIALAKLLKQRAPDVFALMLANARKWHVSELLESSSISAPSIELFAGQLWHDPQAQTPEPAYLDASRLRPLAHAKVIGGEAIIKPVMGLFPSPVDHGRIIAADLTLDPADYVNLSQQALIDYCRANRFCFLSIKANAQPILMPLNEDAVAFLALINHIKISLGEDCGANPGDAIACVELRMQMILKAGPQFIGRLSDALIATRRIYPEPVQIDEQLYSGGFITRPDALLAERMSDMEAPLMAEHIAILQDPRLQEYAQRWVFAQDPHALAPGQQAHILQMLRTRLLGPPGMPWRTIAEARKELLTLQINPSQHSSDTIDIERQQHINAIALWLHRLEQAHLNPSEIFAPQHNDF